MRKKLIMTVGLPRSGKSTWARKQGKPIVCPDAIRLALHGHQFIPQAERHVWAMAHTMVEALFLAGHDEVILDATNVSQKRRDEWQSNQWECEYIFFDTPKEVCIERAKADGMENLTPVIERMYRNLEVDPNWPAEVAQ